MSSSSSSSSSPNLWVLLGLGLAGVLLMTRRLRRAIKADLGAFVNSLSLLPPPPPPPPKAPFPLSSLSFAISDLFDVEGLVTGFGSSDWEKTHRPAEETASVVSALVASGASCVGKTTVDEMAFSISGENKQNGMPTNPANPDRIPGGSSSGSAVAVAAQFVDFALGVDSVGGVRIPASYCGVLGFKPSHSAVLNIGVIPVSPSLDTIGWFARDPSILHKVGHVLLRLPYMNNNVPKRFILADDCFDLVNFQSTRLTHVVIKSIEKLIGRQGLSNINLSNYLASKVSSLKELEYGSTKNTLISLGNVMHLLQKIEFKNQHIAWIDSVKPSLNPQIKSILSLNENSKNEILQSIRDEMRIAINSLLKDDAILVIPTVPGIAPKINSREIHNKDFINRVFSLSSISSLSGSCQVTIPLGNNEKSPISVSLIARNGNDRFLLDATQFIYSTFQQETENLMKSDSNTNNKKISSEDSAESAKEKGNVAFREQQYQKAVNLYSEAIRLNKKKTAYYSNRAAAYLELGSYRQAETDCTSAIELDSKNVKAYLRRGTAREFLGYYKEAIEDFKYALVLEPTNKTAHIAVDRLGKLFL